MDKNTTVVRRLAPEGFKAKVWGVDKFEWLVEGKVHTSHAPEQDVLDALGYMVPLTPEYDPLAEVVVPGSYTVDGAGIISEAVRDLEPEEIADRKAALVSSRSWETEAESDRRVNQVAPARQHQRAIAKGAKLNRKKIKHLSDPAKFPDLTESEEELAGYLEALQDQTEAIRDAEDKIIEEIIAATLEDLAALDVKGHALWP